MRHILFVVILVVAVSAQVPQNTPCTTGVSDCCITGIEHVTIDGITYAHEVCRNRQVAACTPGCSCQGLCADSTAQCSCLDPTPSTTRTASQTRTPSATPSRTPSPSETATRTASPSRTQSPTSTRSASTTRSNSAFPSRSIGASHSATHTKAPSASGSRTPRPTPPGPLDTPSVTPTHFSRSPVPASASQTPAPKSASRSADASPHVALIVVLVVCAVCCLCLCVGVVAALGIYKKSRQRKYANVQMDDQGTESLAANAEHGLGDPDSQ